MTTFSPWLGRAINETRALQILVTGADGSNRAFGSGYQVSRNLVLTARHVANGADDPDASVVAWTDGGAGSTATVCWRSPSADLALLRLDRPEQFTDVPGVAWGRLVRAASAHHVPFELVGYPESNLVGSRRSRDFRTGRIDPVTYTEHRLYALDVDGPAAARPARGRTWWSGISGAAVFCDGLLVAVVTADQTSNEPGRLTATPIETVQTDPEFCRLAGINDTIPLATPALRDRSFACEVCLHPVDPTAPAHTTALRQRLEASGCAVRSVASVQPQDLLGWIRRPSAGSALSLLVLVGPGTSHDRAAAEVTRLLATLQNFPSVSAACVTSEPPRLDVPCPVFDYIGDFASLDTWLQRRDTPRAQAVAGAPGSRFEHRLLDPYPLSSAFVGRRAERTELTWWLTDDRRPVKVVSAIGGMGKSALAWVWAMGDLHGSLPNVAPLVPGGAQDDRPLFWFSFYRPDATPLSLLQELLAFARPADDWSGVTAGQALRHAQRVLQEDRLLIVLDGVERQLRAYNRLDSPMLPDQHANLASDRGRYAATTTMSSFFGLLHDPAIRSKVLITTRLMPADLEAEDGTQAGTCSVTRLDSMPPEDAVLMFRSMNIRGTESEILRACRPYGFHPLTLALLAGMIANDLREPRDIATAARRTVSPLSRSRRVHIVGDAVASISEEQLDVLRPLAAMRVPVTYDLLERIMDCDADPGPEAALSVLITRGLVMFDDRDATFDLHPIVRGYVYGTLLDADRFHEAIAEQLGDEIDDHVEAMESAGQSVTALRKVQPFFTELLYQLVMANEIGAAVDVWTVTLPLLTSLGDHATALECAEAMCRDEERLREEVEDPSERFLLYLTWAESGLQMGRLDVVDRAVARIGAEPAEPPDDDPDDDVWSEFDAFVDELRALMLCSLRVRTMLARGHFSSGLELGADAVRRVLDLTASLRTFDPERSWETDGPDRVELVLRRARDVLGEQHVGLLAAGRTLALELIRTQLALCGLDGLTEQGRELRAHLMPLQREALDSAPDNDLGRDLLRREVELLARSAELEPTGGAPGRPNQELVEDLVRWLRDVLGRAREQVIFPTMTMRSMLRLQLIALAATVLRGRSDLPPDIRIDVDALLDESLAEAVSSGSFITEMSALLANAEYLLLSGHHERAEDDCRRAVAVVEKAGMDGFLPQALCTLARIRHARGDEPDAVRHFERARRLGRESDVQHLRPMLGYTAGIIGVRWDTSAGNVVPGQG